MNSAETLLELRGVSAGYGDRIVVGGVNLTVAPGEIVALLGPNGCGKSTLLKTAFHALPPLAGTVELLGEPIRKLSALEIARQVGVVFQAEPFVFEVTVREAVLLGRLCRSQGLMESPGDLEAAESAMEATDSAHLADRRVGEISGGELQRVLIARALAQEPRILLLDEPQAHLDPGHHRATSDLIQRLAAGGLGVLMAVHDLNWTIRTATRVVMISEGQTVFSGPTEAFVQEGPCEQVYGTPFARVATGERTWLIQE